MAANTEKSFAEGNLEQDARKVLEQRLKPSSFSPAIGLRKTGELTFDPNELPTGATIQGWSDKVEWHIHRLLPKRAITILHGRGGIGKTWLALGMAEAVAKGIPFLNHKSEQAPVFYVDFENPRPILAERSRALDIESTRFWHISHPVKPPFLDAGERTLYKTLPEESLIIFDTFRSAHQGDENNSQDIARVLTVLKDLREKGYSVLLLHHTAKGNDSRYKGSTAILDLADHELNLCEAEKKDDDGGMTYRLSTPQKSRYEKEELLLDFDLDQGGFIVIPDGTEGVLKRIQRVMLTLPVDTLKKTRLVDHLHREIGLSKAKIQSLLTRGSGRYWQIERKPSEKNSISYRPVEISSSPASLEGPGTGNLSQPDRNESDLLFR